MTPRLACLLGLVLLLAPRAWAGGPRKPPVFGSEVSLVSLPVFVADKQGRALAGLQGEDFELYDDGQRARLVSFQYVDTTSPESQAEIREVPAARRHFLLLFDLSFTTPRGLASAQKAAGDLVRRGLAESDLVAVATFDVNRGVRLIANFTEDRALLRHAVDTLGVGSLARISDPLELAADLGLIDIQVGEGSARLSESNPALTAPFLAALARRMREADDRLYQAQVAGLVGSLQELARGLRNVEGRKQVVYFSAGFDSRALVGLTGSEMRGTAESVLEGRLDEVDSIARYGDSHLRETLAQMTRALSSADCVVHAIDVTGFGRDLGPAPAGATHDAGRDPSGREALSFLAAETGGRLFKDSNELGTALGELLEMTSRYYILGYQPEGLRGPGRFHKLKVKVRRPGARVSHRGGYFERLPRTAQTPLQRKFEAAQLVMTGAGASDLGFSALCLPFPQPGPQQTLGVVVQVPREQVRWEAGRSLALEVYGYAVARDGAVLDHIAQLARLDPGKADPQGRAQGVSFYGTLRVPAGNYTVKLMVQDPESGTAGVQFLDVTVPPYEPRSGFLLPPVVMDDAQSWLGLEMNAGRPDRSEFPFAVAGRPFLPRTSFQVRSGTPEKLVLIAYEPEAPRDPAAGIEIQSSLRDAAGSPVGGGPMRLEKVHRDGRGRRTYILDFTPEGLAPGDYTLRIGIGESGSRLESYALVRVRPGPSAP